MTISLWVSLYQENVQMLNSSEEQAGTLMSPVPSLGQGWGGGGRDKRGVLPKIRFRLMDRNIVSCDCLFSYILYHLV